jgi:hypothetical protein
MGKLCGGQGPAEEVALPFSAVLDLKECQLFLRFDALGNHALLEVFAHINYGAHDWRVIGICSDPVDKGLVDFQDINGKLLKIAEARIAGAEAIYHKLYPHQLELMKYGSRGFGTRTSLYVTPRKIIYGANSCLFPIAHPVISPVPKAVHLTNANLGQ